MSNFTPLMLRAISTELTGKIIPDLASANTIEAATLASQVLEQLASDIDLLAKASAEHSSQLRASLRKAIDALPESIDSKNDWQAQLECIARESDIGCQREVRALRHLSSTVLKACTDAAAPDNELADIAASLGQQDILWLATLEAANSADSQTDDAAFDVADTEPAPTAAEPTTEELTNYLREHYPESPELRVSELFAVPGGRSKKTWIVSIENSGELPTELVMRQDYQLHYEGTKVRDEFEPLEKFSSLNLPVPKPLLLQSEKSSLGQPFMLMQKLEGSPPGSYFGLREHCPGAFRELAHTLAHVHRADPSEMGFSSNEAPEQNMLRLIEGFETKWRENSLNPSPLIDYAFSWARKVCLLDEGQVAVVHGDVGPHNMLVQNDRLTALLDWEFSHLGDPAEDLGIARVYAEDVMPWKEFMRCYLDAGGKAVPDRRIELAMTLHFLKGASLVAVSGRNFEEGWTTEFVKGATSFAGLRQIESVIAGLLKRFNAA